MAQYNPLDALKKATGIGPAPRTPYEWSRAKPEDFEVAALPAPPRPAALDQPTPRPPKLTNINGEPFVPSSSQVRNPSGAALAGLQGSMGGGLEVKAPFVKEGAQSPSNALQTFRSGASESTPQSYPGMAEMAQLASRDPETTAPGAGDYWKEQLGQRLAQQRFDLPDARAAREMEAYKIGGPERVADITGRYDVQQQQEASRGALDVASSKGEQTQNFLNMLAQTGQGGNVSRLSVPGAGSVSFQQKTQSQIPPILYQELQRARDAFNASKGWMGSDPNAAATYDQVKQNFILRAPIPDGSKEFLSSIVRDPDYANMSLQEILADQAALGNAMDATPEEILEVETYLNALREQ